MSKSEEQIRRAIEEGKFDQLPGKGKPLPLEENPHADPDWRLAHHVLRSSGFTLPWIETSKEIDDQLEAARADLQRAWRRREDARAARLDAPWIDDEWQRAETAFRQRVEQINRQIRDYNLSVPSLAFQRRLVDVARELAALSKDS